MRSQEWVISKIRGTSKLSLVKICFLDLPGYTRESIIYLVTFFDKVTLVD